jgi:8-oxo-dGTP pyrophosphatase MutT (NUDIX family)
MGALRTSDGAYVLGVMGAHTSNPGSVYFPSGTPDPADVTGGSVDLFASVQREVTEETGLAAADFVSEPGWVAVLAGPQLALMKPLQLVLGAEEVARRVRGFLGRERNPELADVRIVRRRAELPGECPQFMTSFLRWALAE